MRFGVRKPSLRGRISARTSWKRHVRHSMGLKAPRGFGIFTNPKKALYNKVYNRTTVSADDLLKAKKSSPYSEYTKGPGFLATAEEIFPGLMEHAGALLFGCVVFCGLCVWLGLSWKFSLALTGLAALYCVVGEAGFKFIVVLAVAGWIFLH